MHYSLLSHCFGRVADFGSEGGINVAVGCSEGPSVTLSCHHTANASASGFHPTEADGVVRGFHQTPDTYT
jgi:hypothetical protein